MKKRVNVKVKGHPQRMTGIHYPLLKVVKTIKGYHKLKDIEDMQPSDYFEKK